MFNAPVPFDLADETEIAMRILAGNIAAMQVFHDAFIGTEDEKFASKAFRDIETRDTLLDIIEVPGDHGQSVHPAANEFLRIIANDIKKAQPETGDGLANPLRFFPGPT